MRASDASANGGASVGGDSGGRVSWAPEGGWPGEDGGGGGKSMGGLSIGERPGSMGTPSMASIAELGEEMGGGLGLAPVGPCASPFREEQGGIRSRDEDGHRLSEVYFFGIIDILQTYNRRKQAETFFKVRADGRRASTRKHAQARASTRKFGSEVWVRGLVQLHCDWSVAPRPNRHASSPLRHFASLPLHHFTTSPLHHFTTSPLHRFTTSPLHHFTSSPLHQGFKHKKADISCVEPPLYSSRFSKFMESNSE